MSVTLKGAEPPGITKSLAAQGLPQSTTATLFTVNTGPILVQFMYGLVTTAIQNQACTLSLGNTPSGGANSAASVAPATAITNATLGTLFVPQFSAGLPVSAVATPSVPASTVAKQNPYPFPVQVVITGGTLTAVVVNGVTVGTAAGTYYVPAYGSISTTNSGAPTWAWTAVPSGAPIQGNVVGLQSPLVPFIVPAGVITWTTSASNTGQMAWNINYLPIDSGAYVS